MRSEDRLAEAIRSSAGVVDTDAVFTRIARRKTRRAVARKARVPAALAMAVVVVMGAVALSSPGEPTRLVADRARSEKRASEPAAAREPQSAQPGAAQPPTRGAMPSAENGRPRPGPGASAQAPSRSAAAQVAQPGTVYGDVRENATPNQIAAASFPTPQHGWTVASESGILATSDGGQTWVRQAAEFDRELTAIEFVNARRGWAVGPYAVLHTSDGGQTWIEQAVPTPTEPTATFTDLSFIDERHGWVVGNCGVVIATADGGAAWETLVPGDCSKEARVPSLTRVLFADAERGWAVFPMGREASLLATLDGGRTWEAQPAAADVTDVFFADATSGWAVTAKGTILATFDGGRSWARQPVPRASTHLLGVFFADVLHGWAVGMAGDEGPAVVFATRDGGRTWTEQSAPVQALHGGIALTPTLAWAYGGDGLVHTADGGATWNT